MASKNSATNKAAASSKPKRKTVAKKKTATARKRTTTKKRKAPAKRAAKPKSNILTPEEWTRKTEETAYYIAESDGFRADPVYYWVEAQKQRKAAG